MELVLQIKKDMETRGCDPDLATWRMVIHQLYKSNKLNEAYELFDKMVQMGIAPKYITYEMIMNRLSKSVQSNKCQLLSEMMAATPHSKLLPNTYKRNNAQDIRTKKIISKVQEVLLSKEESKHLPRMAKTNTYKKESLTIDGDNFSIQRNNSIHAKSPRQHIKRPYTGS